MRLLKNLTIFALLIFSLSCNDESEPETDFCDLLGKWCLDADLGPFGGGFQECFWSLEFRENGDFVHGSTQTVDTNLYFETAGECSRFELWTDQNKLGSSVEIQILKQTSDSLYVSSPYGDLGGYKKSN